jgi:hypothetical protein
LSRAGNGLQEGHRAVLSKLFHGAKAGSGIPHPSRFQQQHQAAQSAAIAEPSVANSAAGLGSSLQEEFAVKVEQRCSNGAEEAEHAMSPGLGSIDVLMTPHATTDELNSMLEFLESEAFDMPRASAWWWFGMQDLI